MKKKLKIFGIIIAIIAIFFILIIYISFFTNLWRYYPNPFKTQTALSLLEMSVFSDPICHETCFAKRELYKDVISDYALKNKDIKKQIENSILDQEVHYNFKQELVKILRLIAEKEKKQNKLDKIIIPEFLFTYLNDKKGDGDVKKEIMSQFGDAQDNRLLKNLYDIASNPNINKSERAEAINTIGNIGNADSVEFLMKMIEDEKELYIIRFAAADKISVLIGDKKIKITKDLADRAIKIALNKNTNNYIAEEILDVAYYYDSVDKNYVIKIMQKVYNSDVNKFVRNRSANILNGLTEKNKYKKPKITSDEWKMHIYPSW